MNAVQKKMPESDFLALPKVIYSEKVTFLRCRSSFAPRKSLSWHHQK